MSDDFIPPVGVVCRDVGQIVPSQVPRSAAHGRFDVLIEGDNEGSIVDIRNFEQLRHER
jgi:hypothetical protein